MLDEKQYVQEIVYWYPRPLGALPDLGPRPNARWRVGVNWNTGRFNRIVFEDSGPNPSSTRRPGKASSPWRSFAGTRRWTG